MKSIIGAILAGLAFSAVAGEKTDNISRDLDSCKSVTVRYISNGTYKPGDTDELSLIFKHEETIARAKRFLANKNYRPSLSKSNGACELFLSYKE